MPADKNTESFLLGNGCMLLATLFWGMNIPFTKALIPDWMTADSISAVRLIGPAILFWSVSLFCRCDPIKRSDWLKVGLGGAVGLFAFIYFFILSLRYGNAIDISIIMTLPPMFVILMGVFFEHQRPALMEYAGIALSLLGAVIVILLGNDGAHAGSNCLLGDILAVLSAICFALYLVILEKPSKEYAPVSLLRWVYLCAAIPGLSLTPGMLDLPILHADSVVPWLEIAFILFCPSFFAYFLVSPALKRIGSELSSLYQYLIPIIATITAIIMGVDKLALAQVIAMAVIIAGMVLTNLGKKKRVQERAAH